MQFNIFYIALTNHEYWTIGADKKTMKVLTCNITLQLLPQLKITF